MFLMIRAGVRRRMPLPRISEGRGRRQGVQENLPFLNRKRPGKPGAASVKAKAMFINAGVTPCRSGEEKKGSE